MFAKLFGKDKPKVDPTKLKEMEEKKDKFEIAKSKDDLNKKIDENHLRMAGFEKQIAEKTSVH